MDDGKEHALFIYLFIKQDMAKGGKTLNLIVSLFFIFSFLANECEI